MAISRRRFSPRLRFFTMPVAQVLQIECFQDLDDLRLVALSLAGIQQQLQHGRFPVRPEKGEHQIVDHAEIVERGGELERAHQAPGDPLLGRHAGDVFAFVADRAFVGRVIARQQIEERGLAGAVRADDAGDLVLPQQIVDVVDGDQCAETFGDAFRPDDFGARPWSQLNLCQAPRRVREACAGAEIDGVSSTAGDDRPVEAGISNRAT